jgi:hypothetical protein
MKKNYLLSQDEVDAINNMIDYVYSEQIEYIKKMQLLVPNSVIEILKSYANNLLTIQRIFDKD